MRHQVRFRPRAVRLEARGLVAEGPVVAALWGRLRERAQAELATLRAVYGRELLVLLASGEALPWCDGVRYCGSDGNKYGLLFPVELEPDVPVDWLHAALPGSGPRLVLPHGSGLRVVPLSAAQPLTPARLFGA